MIKELPDIGRAIKRAAHVIWTLNPGRPGTEALVIPAQGPAKTFFVKTWGRVVSCFAGSHVIG